jgi:hypothetical protein
MKEVKTNKYYSQKYLTKELKAQQLDIGKDINERESNAINRAIIYANNLIKSRIKNNRMEENDIENKNKIIEETKAEYLNCIKIRDEYNEKMRKREQNI